ncbi:glutamate-cysteine ligase [Kribbella voronezhensis]|uniref:glutamate--cysteine ligase n=1 Tax=Kribbella voronezhensis TaxID=2512212 RepID=A0A4R7SWN8_9ACTN|nr:glutamate-cysteine ligase family protein [Kribbella voronezhensis]TDU83641.1 glutamate-cysteine ligase [Kribbella voronezhensis]
MDTKEQPRLVADLFTRGRRRTTRVAVEQEFIVADTTTGAPVPIDLVRRSTGAPTTPPTQAVRPSPGTPTTPPTQAVDRSTGGPITQSDRPSPGVPTTLSTQSAGRSTGAPTTPPTQAVRPSTGAAACLSFEPGGQIELSLPCVSGSAAITRLLTVLTDDLRQHLDPAGIRIDAIPCDPRPTVPLQLTTPRYAAMQRHFDTIGPAGRRMMRRTASTQVCLDWWPGEAGAEQWRVLNLAAPFLAAAFARSTGPDGRLTTWLSVDPDRTGFDNRLLAKEPGACPIPAYISFAEAATPFTDGPAEHLSTLFPPVRPRATYLEVRFLDAQEPAAVAQAIAALENLMYDDDLRRRTLRALEPELPHLADHWRAAAAGDPGITSRGRELAQLPNLELVA